MKNPLMWMLVLLLIPSNTKAQKQIKTLASYIEAAQSNSPLIADYKNQTQLSDLELERLQSLYNRANVTASGNIAFVPIISKDNGSTQFAWNTHQATNYYGYDQNQMYGNQSAIVTWTQPLLGAKNYKVSQQNNEAQKAINTNKITLAKHDIEKLVTDQYILCLLDRQQWNFSLSTDSILQKQFEISSKLAQQGLANNTDIQLLHIEKTGNRATILNNKQTYYSDLLDLNILCGIKDTSVVQLETLNLEPQAPSNATSQYLKSYQLDSFQLETQQSEFQLQYRPHLNLYANAGLVSTYYKEIPQRLGASAGLTFTWVLFDGHQKQNNLKKIKLSQSTLQSYKESFITENEVRKHKCLSEINTYTQREQLMKEQLNNYNDLMQSYRKLMAQGQMSVVDYITVLKNRKQLNQDYLLLKTNKLLLTNAYNYWNW